MREADSQGLQRGSASGGQEEASIKSNYGMLTGLLITNLAHGFEEGVGIIQDLTINNLL